MRPSVKKRIRVVIGALVGGAVGGLLAYSILWLMVFVCEAADSSGYHKIGRADLYLTIIGFLASVIVGPLIGMVVGIVIARWRNRREDLTHS